jgi:nitronate monooxygenase
MERYVDEALEAGIRFFVTALGNPRWVVDRVAPAGGVVYHDCVDRRWGEKGLDGGVHGLIAVNDRAGGHAGRRSMEALAGELLPLGAPVVCAGGIGDGPGFVRALSLGYAGVQMGTRFIATPECRTHADYKDAIVRAGEDDVVLTERITGVPVSVLRTPYVERVGTKAGALGRLLLRGRTTKHWVRAFYAIRSVRQLKAGLDRPGASTDYWQAGKSVAAVRSIEPAGEIVRSLAAALEAASKNGELR